MPAIFTSRKTRCGRHSLVLGDAVGRVGDGAHLVALELEQLAERGANALLVVDDEDAAAHGVAAPVVL